MSEGRHCLGWIMVTSHVARTRLRDVRGLVGELCAQDLHSKRVEALAQARGLVTKHAVKLVNRLMSNAGFNVWESFARRVPHQVGTRPNILVAMDWTDFDHDDQSTLVLRPRFERSAWLT